MKRKLLRLAKRVERAVHDGAASAWRRTAGRSSPLPDLDADAFDALAAEHAESIGLWCAHLDGLLDQASKRPDLMAARGVKDLPFEAREELRSLWESLLDCLVALDRVKEFHRHFPAISAARHPDRHARAFGLAFAAAAAQFDAGLRFIRLTEKSPAVVRLLDEAVPEHGLPSRRFDLLKWNVLHVADVARLAAGALYLDRMEDRLRRAPWGAALVDRMRRQLSASRRALASDGARWFAENGLAILKMKAFDAWFPVQKGIAHWMGQVKLKVREKPLIAASQLRSLRRRLEPGDILIERRNWNLSNVGLPGFWPHAALYVGDAGQVAEHFDGLAARLKERHPAEWKRYLDPHEDGRPVSVIEAMSPGVIFNSLEKSAGADYVSVLRPGVPKAERATAVERAFGYLGRPYDFDFDFLTDAALVCSEVVYKCYQPGPGRRGVPFELVPLAGRPVLPPNEMIAQFDRWTERREPHAEFVAFLDGLEKRGEAVERDARALCESHRRPKWDFMQK